VRQHGSELDRPRVDVVIPVYNEERDLERSITTLRRFLLEHGEPWRWRIVVADNASIDRTLAIAEGLATRWPGEVGVVHLDQKGRGRALRQAWSTSDADVVCYMDVDLSTDLLALPPLIRALTSGYDVAFGSRLKPGARVRRGLKREIISRSYNALIKLFFWHHFWDAQCGFKGVTRRVVEDLVPLVQDQAWFFDTELLLIAEKNGYRLYELPVAWVDDPDSRVKIVKTAWEDVKGLWRLKRHFPRVRQSIRAQASRLV
jgi:glycosyltransferase involved in cell wall biosynthesis